VDDIYSGIFSALYQFDTERPDRRFLSSATRLRGVYFFGEEIRRAIDEAAIRIQVETGIPIRPDAKYFLWVNVLHMIAAPISISEREPLGFVLDAATHDVELLIRAATEGMEDIERREVSAHRIVDALSRSWKALRLNEVHIWDGSGSR
jgi:hypothetical protein